MAPETSGLSSQLSSGLRPFRTAVLRGLGVVAAPLLTLVILLWIVRTVDYYILEPVLNATRDLVVREWADIRTQLSDAQATSDPSVVVSDGKEYKRLESDQFIPLSVYSTVMKRSPGEAPPESGQEAYRRWLDVTYLRPWIVGPVFLVVFVLLMYVLGILFAAGLGRAFWGWFEQGIGRLPLVRAVYSSAKQVTNYVFSDRELDFTRVVAVEYPCRNVWSLAFVTNEGMNDVQTVAGMPMVTILLPTSPVPVSGYTMLVPKSDVLDVEMTVEQAVEYIVSCGVVLPPEQLEERIEGKGEK
ncbi:MAG TPA: DUF502 domain-containing protein [Pirellulales bacterium]|nr:DUF502 domain-containing protein [Pirellulales bacterium]